VATYRVIDVRRPGDREPQYVTGTGRLILATAAGSPFLPSGVLRVDARLTSQAQPAPRQLPSNYLSDAEAPLAIDSNAWFPLVIWLQGLAVGAVLIMWARTRWGRWQVWIVAVPVIGFFGLSVADQVARLLLNLT
jgi:hypothetical protein